VFSTMCVTYKRVVPLWMGCVWRDGGGGGFPWGLTSTTVDNSFPHACGYVDKKPPFGRCVDNLTVGGSGSAVSTELSTLLITHTVVVRRLSRMGKLAVPGDFHEVATVFPNCG
jgi:hypothetical protein